MSVPMRWWLISDETVDSVRKALEALGVVVGYKDALHDLNSDLHRTDEVPDDWKTGYGCGCKVKGHLVVDDADDGAVGEWLATDRSLCFPCWQDESIKKEED